MARVLFIFFPGCQASRIVSIPLKMVPIHTHTPVHHRTPAYLDSAMKQKPYDESMADNSAEPTDTIMDPSVEHQKHQGCPMGMAFAFYTTHIASTWFIGVEILRKSVLTIVQNPLDTGRFLGALFPMNTK
jgi:hypothetical protein